MSVPTAIERPDDWPQGIRAISQERLKLLGIKEATGQLDWNGNCGTFLVNLARFVMEKLVGGDKLRSAQAAKRAQPRLGKQFLH
jgi:hypothetical protein